MKFLHIFLVISLLFSTGCNKKKGRGPAPTPSPTAPSPSPAPSPTPSVPPAPTPTPVPETAESFTSQGFAMPACDPTSSKPFYLFIDQTQAAVDYNGECHVLTNWFMRISLIQSGQELTISSLDNCPPITDFIPLAISGDLTGPSAKAIYLEFKPQANNTIFLGEITLINDCLESLVGFQGLCLDNGYAPCF